jgi:hypothetical protein
MRAAASRAGRIDLTPDLPRVSPRPLGRFREALARHNARLNANSSDICCSSAKASTPRASDLAQIDIKYPLCNEGIRPQSHEGICELLVTGAQIREPLSLRIAAPYARFIWKSSSFLPDRSSATSHRGCFPRPAQVSPRLLGLRYLGKTLG